MTNKELFFKGMKDGIPVVLGYIPVGIAYAVSATKAGFTDFETVLMSFMVYSGSGQVLSVGMTAQGASFIAIVIGTFLINFRYAIMSTCVFNRLPKDLAPKKKLLTSFFVTDEAFALFTIAEDRYAKLSYLAGIMSFTYCSWWFGAILGIMANSILPQSVSLGLGIALYALFIAIIVPGCRNDSGILVLVVATALFNIMLSNFIEGSWAIVISTILGALIGAICIKDKRTVKCQTCDELDKKELCEKGSCSTEHQELEDNHDANESSDLTQESKAIGNNKNTEVKA